MTLLLAPLNRCPNLPKLPQYPAFPFLQPPNQSILLRYQRQQMQRLSKINDHFFKAEHYQIPKLISLSNLSKRSRPNSTVTIQVPGNSARLSHSHLGNTRLLSNQLTHPAFSRQSADHSLFMHKEVNSLSHLFPLLLPRLQQ